MQRVLKERGAAYILRANVPEDDTCYEVIRELIDEGCDVIISGYGYHEPYMAQAAKRFPGITFLQVDGSGAYTDVSNLYSINNDSITEVDGPARPGWKKP